MLRIRDCGCSSPVWAAEPQSPNIADGAMHIQSAEGSMQCCSWFTARCACMSLPQQCKHDEQRTSYAEMSYGSCLHHAASSSLYLGLYAWVSGLLGAALSLRSGAVCWLVCVLVRRLVCVQWRFNGVCTVPGNLTARLAPHHSRFYSFTILPPRWLFVGTCLNAVQAPYSSLGLVCVCSFLGQPTWWIHSSPCAG